MGSADRTSRTRRTVQRLARGLYWEALTLPFRVVTAAVVLTAIATRPLRRGTTGAHASRCG